MRWSKALSVLVVALAGATPAFGQRARLAGTIRAADGAPAAGWTVVAIGRTMPSAPELDAPERLEGTADPTGRFHVDALRDAVYDLWAFGPARGDGAIPVTDLANAVGVGSVIELVEAGARPPLAVEITGADAWVDDGPFTVRARPSISPLLDVPVGTLGDGPVRLPPLPGPTAIVEVLDRNGAVLMTTWLGLEQRRTKVRLALPAPVALPVRVTARADDAPIGGATLWQRSLLWANEADQALGASFGIPSWRRCGVTDAEGNAVVRVAVDADPRQQPREDLFLRARADGFAPSHSGWMQRKAFVDGVQVADGQTLDTLPFHLDAAVPLRLTIRDGAQPIAADTPVVVSATSKVERENGWTHVPERVVARTATDGSVTVSDLPLSTYRFAVAVPVRDPHGPAPSAEERRAGPRSPVVVTRWRGAPGTERAIDVAAGREFAIQVLGGDGGPIHDARLLVGPLVDANQGDTFVDDPVRTNAGGRARLRVPDDPHALIVWSAHGYAAVDLTDVDASATLRIELRPFDEMRVVVRDGSGPLAGVKFDVMSSSVSYGETTPLDGFLDQVVQRRNEFAIEATRSAADGSAVLRFVARKNLGYGVQARLGARSSNKFAVEARPHDEAALTIEIGGR